MYTPPRAHVCVGALPMTAETTDLPDLRSGKLHGLPCIWASIYLTSEYLPRLMMQLYLRGACRPCLSARVLFIKSHTDNASPLNPKCLAGKGGLGTASSLVYFPGQNASLNGILTLKNFDVVLLKGSMHSKSANVWPEYAGPCYIEVGREDSDENSLRFEIAGGGLYSNWIKLSTHPGFMRSICWFPTCILLESPDQSTIHVSSGLGLKLILN